MMKQIRVVYDKQCPACNGYCVLAERNSQREMELIDARDASALMDEITRRGLDIDEGMVVEVDGQFHYGADAIHVLAVIEPGQKAFNVVNRALFGNRRVARLLYPLLRRCRNVLLRVLGVGRINNLAIPGREKF